MKTLMSLIFLLAASHSFAGTINLFDGDSVTINPNRYTTVTCSADGQTTTNCEKAADLLTRKFKSCQNAGAAWCVTEIWPNWKANNPDCVEEGSLACMEFCSPSAGSGWCTRNCQ